MQSRKLTTQHKSPLTVRIARWSATHRWLVLGLWLVFVFGLFGTGSAMGTKIFGLDDNTTSVKMESQQAWDVYDAGNKKVANPTSTETMMVVVTNPNQKVSEAAYKDVVAKIETTMRNATAKDGSKLFAQVTDPYSNPFLGLIAPDQTSLRILGTVSVQGDSKQLQSRVEQAVPTLNQIESGYAGYQIHTFGNTLLNDQAMDSISKSLDSSLAITLPLTFVILLLAFGAVAAAFVPLMLGITSLLAAFGFLAIYSNTISKVDSDASQLIVLIGLAVSVDYSLFIVTRYRNERRHGREKLQAIEIASSTAGRAVFFSGITVMISLAGLFFLPSSMFSSMAAGTIAVVLFSVIGSLTFLPALLSIFGKGINWGRIPFFGRDRESGSGFWGSLVKVVMHRPVIFVIASLVLLVALASPFVHLKMGNNSIDGLPDTLDSVQAYNTLNQKWPQGTTLKLEVIVTKADQPATKDAIKAFEAAAQNLPGKPLSNPSVSYNDAGNVAQIIFYQAGSRNDDINLNTVKDLRQTVLPNFFDKLPGVQHYVAGSSAGVVDEVAIYSSSMPQIFIFVLGMSFLLLLIAFHSIVIPFKAIILNLLSTTASYGAMVLVFQDGYLSKQIGFKVTGVIEAFVPIFIFTILFGLSMDYHLFILTRIKELKDKGATSNEAVAKGISTTSGTITSAAAIMVGVFLVFVTMPIIIVRQLGLGLAVAVLIDATVIRSILLPATMRLLGDWNWYIPKFLDWIPHITVEGESEDAPEPSPEKVLVEA